MAISRSSAARLCTKPELEIVDASSSARIRELTPGRLRQKVTIARRLRDKYRDLAKRQRLEARGKRAPQRARPAQGNENTARKAQLFEEVLDRFEARLAKVDGGAPVRPGAGAKKSGAKKGGAKKGGAKKGGAKKAGAKKAGAKKAGAKKAGAKKAGAKKAGARTAGAKKAGARKAGAKKAGAKKAGARTAGARTAGAKKTGAKKAARGGPAGGEARPAEPAKPGAAALKGARQRPSVEDRKMVGRARTVHSHAQAATHRRQLSRDQREG